MANVGLRRPKVLAQLGSSHQPGFFPSPFLGDDFDCALAFCNSSLRISRVSVPLWPASPRRQLIPPSSSLTSALALVLSAFPSIHLGIRGAELFFRTVSRKVPFRMYLICSNLGRSSGLRMTRRVLLIV